MTPCPIYMEDLFCCYYCGETIHQSACSRHPHGLEFTDGEKMPCRVVAILN